MTKILFTPSPTAAPPFSRVITLDGLSYTLRTMWNIYRGDWYFSLTNQSGTLIINQPLIGSPLGSNIYLAPGIFSTSTLLYRAPTNSFEVTP
jgi:hypothetical protein